MCVCFVIFIDESGHPENVNENVIFHGILCICSNNYVKVEEKVSDFLCRLRFAYGVKKLLALHATDIIRGKGPWVHVSSLIRSKLLKKTIEIISEESKLVTCLVSKRHSTKKTKKDKRFVRNVV
jgi:UDP-N-acetylglucosamine:LPS N-acetylglucosamine transferase